MNYEIIQRNTIKCFWYNYFKTIYINKNKIDLNIR